MATVEEQLAEIRDTLADIREAMAGLTATCPMHQKQTSELRTAIMGNGQPGLGVRMATAESQLRIVKWFGSIVGGAVLLAAVMSVWQTVSDHRAEAGKSHSHEVSRDK